MKIVVVRHIGDSRQYTFSVPEDRDLKQGDVVKVKTRYGESAAECVCDSFELSDSALKIVLAKFGATEPLAPVIGKMTFEAW